jgi:tetratricopeptide (TPR) repeat protein
MDVLRDPADTLAGQRYARLLVAEGNFEGGIAALESYLLNPDADPTIRVELGVLYYRVGSYGMAETYLREAVADPRLTGQVRQDAEALLRDVTRRNAPGGKLDGTLSIGLRGQSNPTASSSSDTLTYSGIKVAKPDQLRGAADLDVFLSANAVYKWDLETQNSATWESTGGLFANHYRNAAHYDSDSAKYNPQDMIAFNGTTGIRFEPAPVALSNFTLRPYIGGSELLLDGNQYMAGVGGGLDVDYILNGGATLFGLTYDIRKLFYAKRDDIGESEKQSGYEQYLNLRATQEVIPLNVVVGDVTLRDHNAGHEYFSYKSVEARLTYGTRYKDPLGLDIGLWGTSLYGGPTLRYYEGADSLIDASTTRKDVEWRLGASQIVPLADSLSLTLLIEYSNNNSNISNYTYDNLMGMTTVQWNF